MVGKDQTDGGAEIGQTPNLPTASREGGLSKACGAPMPTWAPDFQERIEGADADRRESGFRAGWRRGRHNVADQQAATSSVRLATGPLSTGGGNAAPARIAKPARRRDRRMIGAAGAPGTSRDG
jgi:hypothetical protein